MSIITRRLVLWNHVYVSYVKTVSRHFQSLLLADQITIIGEKMCVFKQ